MNDKLVTTLRNLRGNPAVVVDLYEQLFQAQYWALVADSKAPLASMEFLVYPSSGDVRELPLFTTPEPRLASQFTSAVPPPCTVPLGGEQLWLRLLEVMKDSDIQVAVDPGEEYGVRLRWEMVLGIVGKYGRPRSVD